MFRNLFLLTILLCSSIVSAKTVVDVTGRTVEVPDNVKHILLGEGRLFHAVALLEGNKPLDRLVGWQGDFRKLDAQNYSLYQKKFPQIDSIPLIGNTTAESISAEKVMALSPDIAIFGLSGHGPGGGSELVTLLEKVGVPVIFVDFRSHPMKNTIPSLRLLGQALGRESQAERYIKFYQDNLKIITDRVSNIADDKKTTVFIELKAIMNDTCCSTAGNGNMGEFLDVVGAKNISKPLLASALGQVNLEKVIAADPDVYIASGARTPDSSQLGIKLGSLVEPKQALESVEQVLGRKGISSLSAVKNHKTHAIWHGFYNSPYNILAMQAFAKWLYPDLFTDIDPKQTMNELYHEFLTVEPSGTFWVDEYHK